MAGNKPPVRQPQSRQTLTRQEVTVTRQGPIPTPEELFQYNHLLPGAADRIITMAEREQAHRVNLEDMATRADIRHRDEIAAGQRENSKGVFRSDMAGQLLGGVVAVLCIIGAVYSVKLGAHPTVSIALVSLPVAAIIKALRTMNDKSKK